MGLADTCRVCLNGQKRLHAISNTLFQEIWEKLTNAKFITNDGKSLLVCYMCCAQLRKAHQLMKRASESEKLLTEIVNNECEQSQNALLLIASQTSGLDYKCVIEHLYPLEYTFVSNTVQEIKKENEEESEEDNEEGGVINIKIEEEDSSQEDNLENDDVESDTPSEYNTVLKPKLESEVQSLLERIDTGASASKRTIKEEPQYAKRIKFEDTTEDINPLTDDVLEGLHQNRSKVPDKVTSKNLSVDSNVKISKNNQNVTSDVICHQVNRISPKVNIVPKHKIGIKNVIAQGNEALTSKIVCNNAENETYKQYLPKSADAVGPSTSLNKINGRMQSSLCKGLESGLSCHTCEYKCVTESELNRHLRKHSEKPYKCDLCDSKFSQEAHLGRHIKHKHTEEKNFSCHMCQYKFVTKSQLNRHLLKHTGEKPYKCDLCDNRFPRRANLKIHIKFKHTKEKNFSCHMCEYKCVTKSQLNLHLPKHTGEKPYKCDFCDKRFPHRANLESHIKFKHTKEKKFSCHMCQYKCVKKSQLNAHLRKHTGEKPYKCDLCDNGFSHRASLERHIKLNHTKEKNFSCHMCQYKFVTNRELVLHLHTHTGEKPYKCDLCDYKTSCKSTLNSHKISKHSK